MAERVSSKKMQILEANYFASTGIGDEVLDTLQGWDCYIEGDFISGWSVASSDSKQEQAQIFSESIPNLGLE